MDIDFYTQVDKELSKIPYCSSKCDYYAVCPVCDRSGSDLASCSLRMLPEDKRRRFVNLYLRGRDGLQAEARELLFNLANGLNLKTSPADMITYIDTILKIDRSFKVTTPASKKVEPEEDEVPQKIEVVVNKKAKAKDPDEAIVRKIEKELDKNPESLFNSNVVDLVASPIKFPEFPSKKREIIVDLRGIKPAEQPAE